MTEEAAAGSATEHDGYGVAELAQRLTLYAYGLFGCYPHPLAEPALRVSGKSPEDLAMEVLTRYFDPQDASVRWQPERGRLLPYLKRVLWSDFVDLKRAGLYRHTDGGEAVFDAMAAGGEGAETRLQRLETRERLLQALAGEPDLRAMLELQFAPEGFPGYTNQELAARLATSVSEIENRKKRLLRRLLQQWREWGGKNVGTRQQDASIR
ncbi:MAG: RNA polymerase sigma factor [Terriglobales bacterium]